MADRLYTPHLKVARNGGLGCGSRLCWSNSTTVFADVLEEFRTSCIGIFSELVGQCLEPFEVLFRSLSTQESDIADGGGMSGECGSVEFEQPVFFFAVIRCHRYYSNWFSSRALSCAGLIERGHSPMPSGSLQPWHARPYSPFGTL